MLYLTPDTTSVLVADRRSRFESAAQRRRTLLACLRSRTARPALPARPATAGQQMAAAPACIA